MKSEPNYGLTPLNEVHVFFTSPRKEREIQWMQEQTEKLTGAANPHRRNETRPDWQRLSNKSMSARKNRVDEVVIYRLQWTGD